MKISDAYPSRYLKAEYLDGPTLVTIKEVTIEQMQNTGDEKPCVYFEETEMGLILNKTNANMIVALLNSDDTDDWIGKQIGLRKEIVSFQGKPTPSIRVYDTTPATVGGFGRKPKQETVKETTLDDVPTEWKEPPSETPGLSASIVPPSSGGDASLWAGEIPDPGAPITGKRKRNSY